jgi:hypothetical protein
MVGMADLAKTGNDQIRGSFTAFRMTTSKRGCHLGPTAARNLSLVLLGWFYEISDNKDYGETGSGWVECGGRIVACDSGDEWDSNGAGSRHGWALG